MLEARPGDVVRIPPGSTGMAPRPSSAMTHLAIVEHQGGRTTDWMEKVSDEQYGAPVRAPAGHSEPPRGAPVDSAQPSRAQQLTGDIAPKLAQLTDSVLFGDVWARPGSPGAIPAW